MFCWSDYKSSEDDSVVVVVACVVSAVVVVAIVGVVVGVCAYKQHSAQMRYKLSHTFGVSLTLQTKELTQSSQGCTPVGMWGDRTGLSDLIPNT